MTRLSLLPLILITMAACESRQPAARGGAALDRAGSRTGEALGQAAQSTGQAVGRAGDWVRDRTR